MKAKKRKSKILSKAAADVWDAFLCESRKKGPFELHEAVGKRLK